MAHSLTERRTRSYLMQAVESLNAPSGAVMLAAPAVDAMPKAEGYKDGSLYSRIDRAAEDNLITDGMAALGHVSRGGSRSIPASSSSQSRHTVPENPLVVRVLTDAVDC